MCKKCVRFLAYDSNPFQNSAKTPANCYSTPNTPKVNQANEMTSTRRFMLDCPPKRMARCLALSLALSLMRSSSCGTSLNTGRGVPGWGWG